MDTDTPIKGEENTMKIRVKCSCGESFETEDKKVVAVFQAIHLVRGHDLTIEEVDDD